MAALAAVALAPVVLAGCSSSDRTLANPFAPAPEPAAAPAKPTPPPVAMAGHWTLASPSGGVCGMAFTAAAGGAAGKIRPEGGCPGNFYTSRQWAFEDGALVIYDHKQQPLARLASSQPPGRFDGTAASGIPVTLSR
jgi:hypothetical protein